MRKELAVPLIALLGGAAGFFLRWWELSSAFETDTGLHIPGSPATLALIVLTAAVALLLALTCRGTHRNFSGGYDQAFAARGNTPYMVGMTVSAFLFFLAGALFFLELAGEYRSAGSYFTLLPRTLLAVLTLVSGGCLLMLGKNNYRAEGGGKYSMHLLLPAYAACLWLMVSYQEHNGDPVILDYVYQLFAVISSVLGAYFMAGFAFERAKTFRTVFFSQLAIYFSLVTLADQHTPAFLLLYGGFLFYFLSSGVALLHNAALAGPPASGGGKRLPKQDKSDREGTPDEG